MSEDNIESYISGKLMAAFEAKTDEALDAMIGEHRRVGGPYTQSYTPDDSAVYKIAATMQVPLSMLLDAGDVSPATMRMAEADGRWWEIGRHYNRWPKIDPLPERLSRAYDWCEAALLRVDDAIGVLRWGLPEPREWD